MAHPTMTKGELGNFQQNNLIETTVDRYDAAILGAPFRVVLLDSVRQWIDCKTNRVIRTAIPNLNGLKKAVAAVRCMHPRKLTSAEIKFVRKAMGFKGVELAGHLDITPEHLSRCEKGDRALSGSAEKILRAFVVNRSHILFDIIDQLIEKSDIDNSILDNFPRNFRDGLEVYRKISDSLNFSILEMEINTAFDPFDPLEFHFRLSDLAASKQADEEEGRWKQNQPKLINDQVLTFG